LPKRSELTIQKLHVNKFNVLMLTMTKTVTFDNNQLILEGLIRAMPQLTDRN